MGSTTSSPGALKRRSAPADLPPAITGGPPAARWLTPILVCFCAKGVAFALLFGPFSGHDEVDHFFYIDRLAAGDGLGVVGEAPLPPTAEPYRAYVADYPYNAEVIQPPLYHILLAPLYLLAPGTDEAKLLVLRLVSIPIGAGVVWLAAATARLLFPARPLLVVGVPLFVALQPQFGFVAAIVNHDILVVLLASIVVYQTLLGLRDGFPPSRQWTLGLLAAAGLWTKASFALVLPVVAVALLLAWHDRRADRRDLALAVGRTLALPLLLIAPWFVRGWWLYGDPTGASRLRQIPGFGAQAQSVGEMLTSPTFLRQMLEDFWGNYGWRQIPYDPLLFRAVWLLWAVALAGLLVAPIRRLLRHRRGEDRPTFADRFVRRGVGLIGLWVVLFLIAVLYVGTIQFTQARFAFPAIVGVALLTLLGLDGWLPARAKPWALPALAVAGLLLNVVVLLRFVLPFYYGAGGGAAVGP